MPTVKDVARVAGVSTATVSRTLSGDGGGVRPETRQRVLEAARALGHEPNRLPMYLKRRAVNTMGFVVNDIGNPFYPAMARGCEDVLRRAGYSLIMASTDEDPERERALLQEMAAERLAGIILTPSGEPSEHLRRMVERGTPIVSLDREPGIRIDRVGVDNDAASYGAVQHLIALGHRRIAVIAGPSTIGAAEDRLAGYRRAMLDARLSADPTLVTRGDLREGGGHRRALELFDLPEPPTALFSVNNLTTIGILRAARQRGISMPDRFVAGRLRRHPHRRAAGTTPDGHRPADLPAGRQGRGAAAAAHRAAPRAHHGGGAARAAGDTRGSTGRPSPTTDQAP